MKHIFKTLFAPAAIVATMALSACSDISEDNRYIELPPVEAKRIVLLEEFTGQKCVNCPDAHVIISGLLEQYPDNLISVSIHGGGDAFSFSETQLPGVGLRNDDGQAYCDSYQISALPQGVVNRNTKALLPEQWASEIRNEIARPSTIDMALTAKLSDDKKSISIITDIDPHDNINGYLQLWVVESGITSIQFFKDHIDQQYTHNHVFRATVNGHDGQPVSLQIREPQSLTHDIEVRDTWNPENLSIVGFVYNNQGVQQAVHAHVGT